jgi:hypothetical protein
MPGSGPSGIFQWIQFGEAVAASVVIFFGWRYWRRLHQHDLFFVVGQTLATMSSFGLLLSYLCWYSSIEFSWVDMPPTLFFAFVALAGSILGLFVLPWGHTRAQWFSWISCVLNLIFMQPHPAI